MAKKIIWHPEAKEDFRSIIDYLLENWSFEVADRFTDSVDKTQELLQLHTHLGARVGRLRSIRKIAIPPFYTLYYTFLNGEIWILNL
nr:type II toxin-antitoxin system RelE/ParE family toxin [Spirosomataceae bacterium]